MSRRTRTLLAATAAVALCGLPSALAAPSALERDEWALHDADSHVTEAQAAIEPAAARLHAARLEYMAVEARLASARATLRASRRQRKAAVRVGDPDADRSLADASRHAEAELAWRLAQRRAAWRGVAHREQELALARTTLRAVEARRDRIRIEQAVEAAGLEPTQDAPLLRTARREARLEPLLATRSATLGRSLSRKDAAADRASAMQPTRPAETEELDMELALWDRIDALEQDLEATRVLLTQAERDLQQQRDESDDLRRQLDAEPTFSQIGSARDLVLVDDEEGPLD